MRKNILEKYQNRYVVVGVPHTFRENVLFYYNGIMTYIDDEYLTLKHGNDELTLGLDLIKSIKASGGTGAYEGN